ncbi:hypothetical protein KL921_002493 [Ogataea angusta]|uniref:RRM domain-containing protein n=1 Tax=Pichia angusta TaxID=870730 RepID=A0AAN6I6R7_PICAN|nr:uncharacterized protein KL928_001793 [Ogataea angusta]KAG7810865.1 hypothetical protein KL921_002493 [Ogataea angusta]KAG7820356.1 hypothetical protein KL928_001793 [Ogataea angusta]KAG7824040.1 hypothetical protein KL909_002777 [Ogataea angusta]KAG7829730.1 hypothetical protein KL920_002589 [Ogataea angusta]KAG7838593.1 hypothetical protein KL943_000669 [Ogataea angusta]
MPEKRKAAELEELEIKLDEKAPLSKKEARLLKKGKKSIDEIQAKKAIVIPVEEPKTAEKEPEKKAKIGVWIGNLAYDTTSEDVKNFLVTKSEEMEPAITESDITRVNIPKKTAHKIKGFAYIDFKSQEHVGTAIALSEQELNGRRLLIKDANSFEGRPQKSEEPLSKNPPSRILFVGNLSFDTTEELLEEHFRHCGEIIRIRMATFEDSGKCKGFCFIDFKDIEGPTNALKDKSVRKLINRPLRLEYGEDRSARKVGKRVTDKPAITEDREEKEVLHRKTEHKVVARERSTGFQTKKLNFEKNNRYSSHDSSKRVASSVALANAPRQSAAIVEAKGKKIKFD